MSLKKNIFANSAGTLIGMVVSFLAVPFYLHYLGIESYALIGIFASIGGMCAVLDLGLSNALNRELARHSIQKDPGDEMRRTVRTLEYVYWSMAVLLGLGICLVAPRIVTGWVHTNTLPLATVSEAVRIMGLVIAVQWPLSFYSGGLLGLQHQVTVNIVNTTSAVLSAVGGILVLALVSPTIGAFFRWQLIPGALQTALMAALLWRALPPGTERPRFCREALRRVWRFAGGLSAISLTAILLTQCDKVVLSRALTLRQFGFYTLAGTAAAGVTRIIGPVSIATFPRFSQLFAADDQAELARLYHLTGQLTAAMLFPITAVGIFFSRSLLTLWIRDPGVAGNTYVILSVLLIGTTINAAMTIPYLLQLASGWTKLTLYLNCLDIAICTPLMIWAARYGAAWAAAAFMTQWVLVLIISPTVMHSRILPRERNSWYLRDFAVPILVSMSTAAGCSMVFPAANSRWTYAAVLACAWLITALATVVSTGMIRARLWAHLRLVAALAVVGPKGCSQ